MRRLRDVVATGVARIGRNAATGTADRRVSEALERRMQICGAASDLEVVGEDRLEVTVDAVDARRCTINDASVGHTDLLHLNIFVIVVKCCEVQAQTAIQQVVFNADFVGLDRLRQERGLRGELRIESAALEAATDRRVGQDGVGHVELNC